MQGRRSHTESNHRVIYLIGGINRDVQKWAVWESVNPKPHKQRESTVHNVMVSSHNPLNLKGSVDGLT